jgi:hypothetical protein
LYCNIHFISFHFASFCFMLLHCASLYFIVLRFISFHFISFRVFWFCWKRNINSQNEMKQNQKLNSDGVKPSYNRLKRSTLSLCYEVLLMIICTPLLILFSSILFRSILFVCIRFHSITLHYPFFHFVPVDSTLEYSRIFGFKVLICKLMNWSILKDNWCQVHN